MNEMVRITASLDAATSALVTAGAAARGMSDEDYVAEAVQRVAESDADYRAFIQLGIDAVDRGDVIPHAEVMTELDAMIAKHRGRCTT